MKPRTAVLLAAYDGGRYIRQQLFSILNQKDVTVDIYIRVDGDSSKFHSMIAQLAAKHANIFYVPGEKVSSPAKNFYSLISLIDPDAYDYFALSDQDDIWSADKLLSASLLLSKGGAQGYSSAYVGFYPNGERIECHLGNMQKYDYFFQSGGPGCTFVVNSEGTRFIRDTIHLNPFLLDVSAHDWLVYFLLRSNGYRWVFDSSPRVYYRQHSNNVAGLNRGFRARVRRVRALLGGWFFQDLLTLLYYSRVKGLCPLFLNPFQMRRTKIHSLVMWFYYWIYIVPRHRFSAG